MINEKNEDIQITGESYEKLNHNDSDNNSYYNKFYICLLVLLIFILTINIPNKDKLKSELKGKLKIELKGELKNDLKDELKVELKNELKVQLKDELKGQLKDELKNLLKDELKNVLKEELKNIIKYELKDDLKSSLKEELKTPIKGELKNPLKDELKVLLQDELKAQLKDELKGILKDDLKGILKDELNEELKKDYQGEIKNQLEKNIKILEQNLIQNVENKIKEFNQNNQIVKVNANIKVGLCVIGKKENLYAKEYVNYYKNLGYNHIFIYDNNDVNDEKFEDVLSKEISENFVTIINYRGYRGKLDRPQFDSYQDCYSKHSGEYDWLSFYDFDEFLFLKEHKNIQEFLSQEKFAQCINIKINWMTYSDNDLIYYEDKPVQERFTTPLPNDHSNQHIKSTVRGHLKKNYWSRMNNPHSSNNNYVSCIPNGEKTDSKSPFHNPPNHEGAYLKHYGTKSLEEFILKIKRGKPDQKVIFDEKMWRHSLDLFFATNKKTQEKIEYIKKELNISFI